MTKRPARRRSPSVAARLPRVAVLMSTYNGAPWLAEQLDSLAVQKGVEVQVFVRDDGSTDETLDILARYSGRWPQLAEPLRGENLRPCQSFLRLLSAVPPDFDFYAFADQDDVWLPDKLRRAVETIGGDDLSVPVLYCSRAMCVDAELRELGPTLAPRPVSFNHQVFENLVHGNTVVMNHAARALVAKHLPAPHAIMHDWWCALVVAAYGRIVFDDYCGVLYRQHGGNVVGEAAGRGAELVRLLKAFLRNPKTFYPIHGQAADFARLCTDTQVNGDFGVVRRLLDSRRSLWSRLRYAASAKIYRSRPIWNVAIRALIALDLY